jgi:photosystem II stability/assembly factor-like uncharacterized protein
MKIHVQILSILTVLSISSSTFQVQAQWKAETCPVKTNLNAISVTNRGSAWIVGDTGTILYKNEGSWIEFPKVTLENIYSIDFINDHNGWAVGSNGTILHFDGSIWNPWISPTKNDLFSVSFKDKDNGMAVGKSGTILLYSDGIWRLIQNERRGNFNTAFYNNKDIWIGGGLECVSIPIIRIQNRQDEELTFTENYESFASINSIYLVNSTAGWAVGSPSTILHFNGKLWEKQRVNERFASLNSVCFINDTVGFTVGLNGTILSYIKNKWTKESSGVTKDLKSVAMQDNIVYAVGDIGTIITKTLNITDSIAGISDGNSRKIEIPEKTDESFASMDFPKFELLPNPCDELLTIKQVSGYDINNGLIIITNVFGQVLLQKKLTYNELNYCYTINTEDFENGFYFLKIIIGEKSSTSNVVVNHK